MVLSALLFPSGRFSPSRFSLVSCWTTPSLSQPNSKVSGSNWKLPDRAAMCDATFDATAAATLDAAFLARLFPLLPVTSWERNEAFASPPVASSGHLDPEARAGAAATDSEDTVCVPLVDVMLEGIGAMAPLLLVSPASEFVGAMLERIGAMAPVLLVNPASETDLKGYVSIAFLPAPLVFAPTLPHLERFDGWTLRYFQDVVQATAASLLHCKTGFENVDLFKTLVPGLRASSPVPVSKGMLKVEEDKRSNVYLVSPAGVLQVSSFGTLVLPLLALVQRTIWKERHQFFINCNDDRDAVVEISERQFVAAAASGTCWSQPEKLEAVQSGQVIQFFIKGVRGARTQVVRGESQDSLGLVAGVIGMDVYAMVGGKVVDHSLSLECIGIVPDCTVSFFFRLRGGSRDNVPGQWTCSNCQAERCWPVRVKCYRCGAPRSADPIPFTEKKGKGPRGPLGRAPPKGPSSVPPTTSSKPHVVPPRGSGPPGAGVGDPPPPSPPAAAPPSEEMVKALLLLQNVMSKEDFSKYEKLVLPPPKKEEKKTLREEELWRRCQTEERLKKQVQMHLEQIKKHEHNLEQQKIMLADVQMQLESVSLEVKALRALVAETKEPEGPSLIAPLPAPRDPPPGDDDTNVPGFDLDMEATPLDSDDDDMVDRNAGTWLTVASDRKKRGKTPVVMKLKGSPASVRKGSLRQSFVDKTCIFEDELSGVEVGKALLKLSPHGFRDMLSSLPPHAFHQFMNFQPDVPLLHELKSSSSSSGSAEGNGPEEFCG